MAQSLSNILVHLVFSTKNRAPWIDEAIQAELYAYLIGVTRNHGCPTHAIGGVADHVHLACSLARTVSIADVVQALKQSSSKWIKSRGDAYQPFAWQNGYGAFSVSQSHLEALRRYIANQREHHRRETYQAEFRTLLKRYRVDYDERYVWD